MDKLNGNFIKIDRKMLEWEWYKNEHTKNVFLHCLLKACWKDTKIEGKIIPRGSFVSSIVNISEELSLTPMEVRTALKHLKSTNELTSKGTNRNTVFTVTNYDLYQSKEQAEQQTDNKRTTNEQQTDNEQITSKEQTINKPLTTNEEYKEDKNIKNEEEREECKECKKEIEDKPKKKEPTVYYPNDKLLNSAFKEFLVMRNKIKKPIATKQALTRMMNKIEKLSGGDNDLAIKILNQSTDHCWQDVYELKENKQNFRSENKNFQNQSKQAKFERLMNQIKEDEASDS